jgi:TolB-like protein/DNA-binding winged helix-turn-helix (wHTH) protein/Tfp pilus assembly protein PilF
MVVTRFQFQGFELDVKRYQLRKNGRVLKLEKIPMELLILLVNRSGELVSREEIIERLWGADVFVETEHGINTAVRKIRQTLGDDPENSKFVETVIGKGYRFVAPVEAISPESVAAPSSGDPSTAVQAEGVQELPKSTSKRNLMIGIAAACLLVAGVFAANPAHLRDRLLGRPIVTGVQSIAVLPLENLSRDPEEAYFADGMTDELITDLAQIGELRVISRTSVMRYKGTTKALPDIARELGVDAIVEGTVERSGNRIKIRAQLIRASDDRHLWAEPFEREIQDVLSLQSEVASSIARQVQGRLTPGPHGERKSVLPAAYEAYLKGRYAWNRRGEAALQEGIEHFKQAIALDPSYAAAYSGMADSYTTLGYLSYLAPKEAFPQARVAALKAIELDPQLAEPHASLAYVHLYYDWDWPKAETEFKKAIELNPNYATAHDWYMVYLMAMGRTTEAETQIHRALELDPLSLQVNADVGFQLYYAGRYDEALESLRKTLEMGPKFPIAHLWLGRALQQKGMYNEALEHYRATDATLPDWPVTLASIGYVQGLTGQKTEAIAMLRRMNALSSRKYVTPYAVALIYASIHDNDAAIEWLENAYNDRANWLVWLGRDPRWEPALRNDPRFQDLIHRVGLPYENYH